MSYLGEGSDFRQQNKPKPMKVGFSDVGNRGSYTPGGDSFKNYSQKDQQTMFQQAGGKDKFIDRVADIEQKYKRSADIQGFLDRTNLFNQFQNRGDGIVRDAQGRQILSMRSPYMTAQAPTFGQLIGDMGRGIGSILQGFAEKGTPMMNFAKDVFGGVQNFFGNQMDSRNAFVEKLLALSPEQRRIYDQLIFQPRMTREEAYARATGQEYAVGGITTL